MTPDSGDPSPVGRESPPHVVPAAALPRAKAAGPQRFRSPERAAYRLHYQVP
jgi:hypothetical protein